MPDPVTDTVCSALKVYQMSTKNTHLTHTLTNTNALRSMISIHYALFFKLMLQFLSATREREECTNSMPGKRGHKQSSSYKYPISIKYYLVD